MAVCLVTGGAGFLGSHLCRALVSNGHSVAVLDNFSNGSLAHLRDIAGKVRVIQGDITCFETVQDAVNGVEVVFHLAAIGQTSKQEPGPFEVHATCSTGTLHVLHAARAAGVRRFIYASTGCVYGAASGSAVSETNPTRPLSIYAASKLAGETHCRTFTESHGFYTVRLRFFNVFGPGQPAHGWYSDGLNRLLSMMLQGRRPIIRGDGRDCQDLLYVDDAVSALLLAARSEKLGGKVYNIGQGRSSETLEVVDCVNMILGTELFPIQVPQRRRPALDYLASTERAQTDLGFAPAVPLAEALRHYLDHSRLSWEPSHRAAGQLQ
jgi:UDP-glucose 4-epimerase